LILKRIKTVTWAGAIDLKRIKSVAWAGGGLC
jgi:hypothetical protein